MLSLTDAVGQLEVVIVDVLDLAGETECDDDTDSVAELRVERETLEEAVLLLDIFEDGEIDAVLVTVNVSI